jgi:hypothetical protein
VTVRIRSTVGGAVVLAVLAGIGIYFGLRTLGDDLPINLPPLRPERACTVKADGEVSLDADQMANAATITAVGVRRGMPERGVTVALATALQESKLENIEYGDRDSVGLFQQRPSKGWGTPAQLNDPRYAARKFYDALRKVRGWEKMPVTEAAQRVQRSAYPRAYEKWEDEATILARALFGQAGAAVSCTVPEDPPMRGSAATAALRKGLTLDWGQVKTSPAGAAGVSLAVADARSGWRYAHWLVSHATGNGLRRVHYADLEWTAKEGTWVKSPPAEKTTARVVAEVFADL